MFINLESIKLKFKLNVCKILNFLKLAVAQTYLFAFPLS